MLEMGPAYSKAGLVVSNRGSVHRRTLPVYPSTL